MPTVRARGRQKKYVTTAMQTCGDPSKLSQTFLLTESDTARDIEMCLNANFVLEN